MLVSIVIPLFNEESGARAFLSHLTQAMNAISCDVEFVVVNDGSTDSTSQILDGMAAVDPRIRPVHLAVNAGHQVALVAGMDAAAGDAVLTMDGDGQHPPEVAVEMIRMWQADTTCAVVQGVREGAQAGLFKTLTSRAFYGLTHVVVGGSRLPQGASDFRLLSRQAVEIVRHYPDRHRNLRILLSALNLRTVHMPFRVAPRLAAESRYTLRKMIRLALDGIFGFSWVPLRSISLLSAGLALVSAALLLVAALAILRGRDHAALWAAAGIIGMLFSAVFAAMSILAEYIKQIAEDVRGRPPYIVQTAQTSNGDGAAAGGRDA